MNDVRGALLAAAGLLFAAVLGALLATEPRLVAIVAVLAFIALLGAGVVSLPAVQRRYPRLRPPASRDADLLRRLGEEIRACQGFRREVQPLQTETEEIAAIRVRVEHWATEVRDALDAERPGWGALFLSDRIPVQPMTQYREKQTLANFLHQREVALQALMEQVT